MDKGRVFKWLAIVLVVVALVALVGGGIVYAATTAFRSDEVAVEDLDVIAALTQVDDDEPEPGVVIAAVDPDGPAAAAGVVRGDILLAINGEPVNDIVALRHHLSTFESGDQVQLAVLHGDGEQSLAAILDEQNGRSYLGIVPCDDCHSVDGLKGEPPHVEHFLGELPHMEGIPFGSELQGAMITSVVPDSPASAAGLKEGDRIVAVDGQVVDVENALADLISAHDPGTPVTLDVERGEDEVLELTVQLGQHPENEDAAYLGVEYTSSPQIRMFRSERLPLGELPFGDMPFREGIVRKGGNIIIDVEQGSPADGAGLQAGDKITKIDGAEVGPENDLRGVIAERQPGDTVTLEIEPPGEKEPIEIAVELGTHPENEGMAYLGVRLLSLRGLGRLREEFGLDQLPFGDEHFQLPFDGAMRQGAIVREVAENSPAAAAELIEGDVITEIDGEPVTGPQELVDAIAEYAPGDAVTLAVFSTDDGEERLVEVMLAEHSEEKGKAYLGVSIGGFSLQWHSGEGEAGPHGMQPFSEFLEQFRGQPFQGQDGGFHFRWRSPEDLDSLPFDLDELPFDFDFRFPPGRFKREPVQPEQNSL